MSGNELKNITVMEGEKNHFVYRESLLKTAAKIN